MAVKFLNDIDVNLNQVKNFAVDNVGSRPAGVEGQLIFRTDTDVLEFYDGTDWVTLGDAAAAGTVTSVNLSGNTGTGTAITGSGIFAIEGAGVISTAITGRTLTISSSVTNYDDWKLQTNSGAGSEFDVTNGLLVSIKGDTAITTSNVNGAVLIDLDDTATDITGSYTYSSITVDRQGRLTAASSGAAPSDATITLNTGAGFTAASGDAFTLDQAANETINFVIGAGLGMQVNSTSVQVDYTTTNNIIDSAADGTTLVAADKFIAEDLTDNIVKEYTIQKILDLVPAGDTYTLPVSAGGGNSSVITLDASTGTDTTVTFNGTPDEIALTESVGLNGSITIGLPDDVTIAGIATLSGGFSASADSSMNSNKITNLATGSADNDAVNVAQLAAAVAGSARFRGGYNANTGLTTDLGVDNGSLDGASNIASELGDFFIVTTDGNAFYSTALEVGDTIYANQIIAANSTPAESSYTVVIQDANIAGAGSTDGATEKGVAGFNSNVFTVTSNGFVEAKVFNGSQRGVVPNTSSNVATVFLNGQGAFTTPPNDFLTGLSFATGTGILTATIPNQSNVTVDLDGRYITGNETITLTGDVTGSGTTSIVTTIAADAVEASMLNNNVISGQTELTATPAATDEFLISDGGVIKRIDYSVLIGGADSGVTSIIASTAPSRIGLTPTTSSSGAVTIGLNLAGLTAVTTPLTTDTLPIVNSSTNKKITVANLTTAVQTATSKAYTIASGETTDDLTYPFTLTAGTINDVMIQVVQSSGTESGETVFCDVDRISTTQCRITFGAALTESVRVLVQKIG